MIFLAIANIMAIGMYELYQSAETLLIDPVTGGLKSLGVIIIYVLMKAMLYKKAWELSNRIL